MSLSVAGVWQVGVWDQTVWADGVWREGAAAVVDDGPNTTWERYHDLRRRQDEELIFLAAAFLQAMKWH